jgi:hypothetical protein
MRRFNNGLVIILLNWSQTIPVRKIPKTIIIQAFIRKETREKRVSFVGMADL